MAKRTTESESVDYLAELTKESTMDSEALARSLEQVRKDEEKLMADVAAMAERAAKRKELSPEAKGAKEDELTGLRKEVQEMEEWMQANPNAVGSTEYTDHRILSEKIRQLELELGEAEPLPDVPPPSGIRTKRTSARGDAEPPSLKELKEDAERRAKDLAETRERGEKGNMELLLEAEIKDNKAKLLKAKKGKHPKKEIDGLMKEQMKLVRELEAARGGRGAAKAFGEVPAEELATAAEAVELTALTNALTRAEKTKRPKAEIAKLKRQVENAQAKARGFSVTDVGEGSEAARAAAKEAAAEVEAIEGFDKEIAELPPVVWIKDEEGKVVQGTLYDARRGQDAVLVRYGDPKAGLQKPVAKKMLLAWQKDLPSQAAVGERTAYEKRYGKGELSPVAKAYDRTEDAIRAAEARVTKAGEEMKRALGVAPGLAVEDYGATAAPERKGATDVRASEDYRTLVDQLRDITKRSEKDVKGAQAELLTYVKDLEAEARSGELGMQDAAIAVLDDLRSQDAAEVKLRKEEQEIVGDELAGWFAEGRTAKFEKAMSLAEALPRDDAGNLQIDQAKAILAAQSEKGQAIRDRIDEAFRNKEITMDAKELATMMDELDALKEQVAKTGFLKRVFGSGDAKRKIRDLEAQVEGAYRKAIPMKRFAVTPGGKGRAGGGPLGPFGG